MQPRLHLSKTCFTAHEQGSVIGEHEFYIVLPVRSSTAYRLFWKIAKRAPAFASFFSLLYFCFKRNQLQEYRCSFLSENVPLFRFVSNSGILFIQFVSDSGSRVSTDAQAPTSMVATVPGEKLLIGRRRPMRNWIRRTTPRLFRAENYICS